MKECDRVLKRSGAQESAAKRKELLGNAVRFAFRIHQLAGGFDGQASEKFAEVRAALSELANATATL